MSRRHETVLHVSLHKCLTVYYAAVMRAATRTLSRDGLGSRFLQLNDTLDALPEALATRRIVSINTHLVDLDEVGVGIGSRFIRDPRDLLLSGYHYHRAGKEPWTRVVDPVDADWAVVNGPVPSALQPGDSFMSYLQRVDLDEGLMAELDFRRTHFDALLNWPDDPRWLLIRYEEIVGDELRGFSRVLDHYRIGGVHRLMALEAARRGRSSSTRAKRSHIRNPTPGQWRAGLPESVLRELDRRHPGLLERYGYRS